MKEHDTSRAFAIALCYAGMVCLAAAVNLLPIFLTTVRTEFGGNGGLTAEQLGRIGGVTFAGLVLGILMAGPLADRWGGRLFSILGSALVAFGLGTLGIAPDYTLLLAAAFIMGLGAGILDMVLSPIVAALQPLRRSSALNWLHSFYAMGCVITVIISMLALRAGIGWRAISISLATVPLLVALGFSRLNLPPLTSAEQCTRTTLKDLCANILFQATALAIFLGGALELGMAQWLPAYAEMSLGFSKSTGSFALLAFSAAMALGRILAGKFGAHIEPITLMLSCCWSSVIMFLLACFAPWPTVALGASIGLGLAGSCLWPTTLGLAANHFPQGGASMFGVMAALGNLGGILMPWLVGVTADRSSLRLGLATSIVCPLLMVLVLVWLRRRTPAEPPEARSSVPQTA